MTSLSLLLRVALCALSLLLRVTALPIARTGGNDPASSSALLGPTVPPAALFSRTVSERIKSKVQRLRGGAKTYRGYTLGEEIHSAQASTVIRATAQDGVPVLITFVDAAQKATVDREKATLDALHAFVSRSPHLRPRNAYRDARDVFAPGDRDSPRPKQAGLVKTDRGAPLWDVLQANPELRLHPKLILELMLRLVDVHRDLHEAGFRNRHVSPRHVLVHTTTKQGQVIDLHMSDAAIDQIDHAHPPDARDGHATSPSTDPRHDLYLVALVGLWMKTRSEELMEIIENKKSPKAYSDDAMERLGVDWYMRQVFNDYFSQLAKAKDDALPYDALMEMLELELSPS